MKARIALGILLVATLAAVFAPPAALSVRCVDEDEAGSCGPDCTVCLCCAPVPRTASPVASGDPTAGLAGSVGAEPHVAALGPLPRDVLHVPKPGPSR